MNLPLKQHHFISHWIPGLVVLMSIVLSRYGWNYENFTNITAAHGSVASISILLLIVAAFLIGEIIDTIRDLLEWVWDWDKISNHKIYWDILFSENEGMQLKRDAYWTFYVLCHNIVISMLLCLFLVLSGVISLPPVLTNWGIVVLWVVITLIAVDAFLLRREISVFTKEEYDKNANK